MFFFFIGKTNGLSKPKDFEIWLLLLFTMIIAEGDRIKCKHTPSAQRSSRNRAVACILTSVCLPQLDRRILDSQPRILESTQLALPVNSCDPIARCFSYPVKFQYSVMVELSLPQLFLCGDK
ncbi:hypothetical protein C8J55DRAFT_264805 [Lentinula edodes]|uniref:Secreted protein n=1 Tax=Lentinula lateritia TaxID=40482 RepID=A0A9W9DEE1_9AGAR|nr:hypothetical protein C8J55DRAFT_264805 [Lentinula edodes]